ncbi:hypothetical protein OH76DRAFT_1427838 [Lentinus brumalis]|uniref:Uncharacterized protein n=1 Tax=Lentinus brumalis TaxID=2498619 RepID=A0A371DUJ4_9APHY|nr:hypothetical protein OH76DRAFT_1427838 [Polyporus brumalis]
MLGKGSLAESLDTRTPWFLPPPLPPPSSPSPPLQLSEDRSRRAGPSLLSVTDILEVALAGLHVAFSALAASRSSAKVSRLDKAWCVICQTYCDAARRQLTPRT